MSGKESGATAERLIRRRLAQDGQAGCRVG